MDPQIALDNLRLAMKRKDNDTISETLEELNEWIKLGGFLPRGIMQAMARAQLQLQRSE